MADVRARAEYLAVLSATVYRDAARHGAGLTNVDRAALMATSHDYDRRAGRVRAHIAIRDQ